MIKLTDILIDFLAEGSLSKDANKSVQAKEYIKKIEDIISNYKSDNKEIKVNSIGPLITVEIIFPNLIVNFKTVRSGETKAKFFPGKSGELPYIEILGCEIHVKPLEVKFNKSHLFHELIHFLDFKNIKTDPNKIGTSQSTDKKTGEFRDISFKKYINHGIEMNAHFFQFFMPDVVKFIEKEKKIPDTFDEFFKDITKNPRAKGFIDDLRGSNKKKIMKRLGTYYNDILKNPDFKIEKGNNVDDQQLKKATNGFVSKLKGILKIK